MCCVHKQDCKCFRVHENGDGEFVLRFADGSLVGTFCERRLAMVVCWLLNRHYSVDTLLHYVFEATRSVKLIEDCERERFVWNVAYEACKGNSMDAEELVRNVMMKMQEERNYV